MQTRTFKRFGLSGRSGMTLVELMVTSGLAVLVLTMVMVLFVSSLQNFAGLGNYAMLTGQSRMALETISREVRESTRVLVIQTNGATKQLVLTNSLEGKTISLDWDASTGLLTMDKTGEATQTRLTGCERWDFSMYQRNPKAGWSFVPTSNLAQCKLINMSWKCVRTVIGRHNTETVVTAQIVMRNKP